MEQMIDVPVDKPTMDKLNKLTKRELVEKFCAAAVEAEVYKLRCQTAIEDADKAIRESETLRKRLDNADKATREAEVLRTKLYKAESYVEQGRAMIEAVMERWYEYDA